MIAPFHWFPFRLRWMRFSIKCAVLILGANCAFADARQACPPLAIEMSCDAQGKPMMSLRAGKDAPPHLDYIIAPQLNDLAAQTLRAGQSLTLPLRAEWGQQISLAVVGLEPAGADMAACCMSVQRMRLPASCPIATDTNDPANPPPDLAISISSDGDCSRPNATPNCVAKIELSQIAGAPVADAPIFVTLTGQDARSLRESEGVCSKMVGGAAVCAFSLNRPWVVDVALDAGRPAGTFELCAALGVPDDDIARTLALQLALARAGYPVGGADGKFGPATVAALTQFIDDSGLPPINAEIPPEALVLLGLSPREDASPANNRACATLRVPPPPLQCDKRTTRARGGECTCLFNDMSRVSASKCACPKGKVLGPQGCVTREISMMDQQAMVMPSFAITRLWFRKMANAFAAMRARAWPRAGFACANRVCPPCRVWAAR